MLHSFITEHRDQITARAVFLSRERESLLDSESPTAEIVTFLTHVSTALQQGTTPSPQVSSSLTTAAGRNGANMWRAGHPIVDVVQSYGNVCQAVTALAAESDVAISAGDFCVFNRCLDDAIGHAVSEYNRITEEKRSVGEIERLGVVAHELRDHLHTAQLSLRTLQLAGIPMGGIPEQLLERALENLSNIIERTLSDVRLAAGVDRRDAIDLAAFFEEVAATAALHAQNRGLVFTVDSQTTGVVEGDRQLLMSAVMNLVHNALKFTRLGGRVQLTVRTTPTRLSMSVEDQCGGLPGGATAVFTTFGDRRGVDRSGLGLGLSIAKRVIQSHGGTIAVHDLPGTGCVFTLDMPLVAARFIRSTPGGPPEDEPSTTAAALGRVRT